MSSQTGGISLHNIPDNVGYRLIELPPDLQTLLESDQPPVLTLEPSEPSALLKAGEKSYALRQKNTSNALILLKPHAPTDTSSGPDIGLGAISTIHETVELDLAPQVPVAAAAAAAAKAPTSKGKWHERFGKNR